MEPLTLLETKHPHKEYQNRYDHLVGIEQQKAALLLNLQLILDPGCMNDWQKKHHPEGLSFLIETLASNPVIILSGDVGCGKTELAQSIGTPLSEKLNNKSVMLFETPSNIRAGGHVGDLSNRITTAFQAAKRGLKKSPYGILLIDEADDLATTRDQVQAHHEDRSGVNVLIKEIDLLKSEKLPLAVILITNRIKSIDPAVVRRAALHLTFKRPGKEVLEHLLPKILDGSGINTASLKRIVEACVQKKSAYNFSDLTNRIGKQSLIKAWQEDSPLTEELILDTIKHTPPSPIITEKNNI